jgi:hypothetical protein
MLFTALRGSLSQTLSRSKIREKLIVIIKLPSVTPAHYCRGMKCGDTIPIPPSSLVGGEARRLNLLQWICCHWIKSADENRGL